MLGCLMIKVTELSYRRKDREIFTGFNCEIPMRGSYLLSGPNGSGKTTLLNLIGGVLSPNSGSITIHGRELSQINIKEQAQMRSIAPQRRIFELGFRVEDVLGIIKSKMPAQHSDSVIEELMLPPLLKRKITELSLGQQQRVSVALALIQKADFYLCDEPFSAQDQEFSQRMLSIFSNLKAEKGIFVISHNTETLQGHFDQYSTLV